MTGSLLENRLLDHRVSISGVGTGDDLETGDVCKQRLGRFAVMLDRADAAAERNADDDRHRHQALRPVVQLGELADDLVISGEHEAVELDLADGPVTAHREPDRGADDARFSKWRVHHSVVAEVFLQAVGHPEDATELPDVLAHDDDLGVCFHRLAQTHVQGACNRYWRHQWPTSPATAAGS